MPGTANGVANVVLSRDPTVTTDQVLEKPWKYVGYRSFSRFVGSDPNFFYVRQYRTLNARVILAMQDAIAELEDTLNSLDDQMSLSTAPDVHNGSFRQETLRARAELIWQIQRKLREYNDYINSFSQTGSRGGVAARDIRSVKRWSQTFDKAISDEELGYIQRRDDLIYVAPKSDSALRRLFTGVAASGLPWFRRHPTDSLGYDPQTTMLYDEEKAESFFTKTIMLVGLCMLIGPLWILEFVHGPLQRLGVITAFITLFLILLSLATVAKPFESLAGAAAYSAVLMVFLQIPPL